MPRAAPGEDARGAVRRKVPEYQGVPARRMGRRLVKCPYRSGMESDLHPFRKGLNTHACFTQLLSGFGVERGRLGEVVSLVGDCRPPPPGNPLQPSRARRVDGRSGRYSGRWVIQSPRTGRFTTNLRNPGGFKILVRLSISFNSNQILTNLKDLISSEYFKEKCSYFTCIGIWPVLKFGSFHSHMCGSMEVEPPSIVMTNVLETRCNLCAAHIVDMMNPG